MSDLGGPGDTGDTAEGAPDAAEGAPDAAEGEPDVVRRTLDLFVFAPVGLVLSAVEDLPGLIAKGRERVETEVRNARAVGEFVVTQGQQQVTQRVSRIFRGGAGEGDAGAGDATTGDWPDGERDAPVGRPDGPAEAGSAPTATPTPTPKPEPDPADGATVEQALEGYDTLSASQVVRRLESLGAGELRAVYRHEASHRNRRTILNRTNQLLEDRQPAG